MQEAICEACDLRRLVGYHGFLFDESERDSIEFDQWYFSDPVPVEDVPHLMSYIFGYFLEDSFQLEVRVDYDGMYRIDVRFV